MPSDNGDELNLFAVCQFAWCLPKTLNETGCKIMRKMPMLIFMALSLSLAIFAQTDSKASSTISNPSSNEKSRSEQEIRLIFDEQSAVERTGDPNKLAKYYDEVLSADYVGISDEGLIATKSDRLDGYKKAAKSPHLKDFKVDWYKIDLKHLHVLDDMAVATIFSGYSVRNGKKQFKYAGRETMIFIRRNQKWQIVFQQERDLQ